MLRLTMSPTESDRQAVRLPAALAFLYPVVRPWRLLRTYGYGLRRRPRPDLAIYSPMKQEVVDRLLTFARVGSGDVLYDLGCGDGMIVVSAAEKFGIRAVGVDVDPQRIAEARANARRHRVEDRVAFLLQDAKQVDVSEATVVTLYLGAAGNLRVLDHLRSQLRPGSRIVSCKYPIPGWPCHEQGLYTSPEGRRIFFLQWHIGKTERTEEAARSQIAGLRG